MVKLQILLRPTFRSPEGIARVKEIAASLGIVPTASGAATVSAEVDLQSFESLFGQSLREVEPRPAGISDFGSPGGAASGLLQIPEPLREHVESITVAPPHVRFGRT